MKKRTLQKALSMLLTAAMVFNIGFSPAFAEGIPVSTLELVECHPKHDQTCGYAETITMDGCTHEHNSDCNYSEGTAGQPCTFVPEEDLEATPPNAIETPSSDTAVATPPDATEITLSDTTKATPSDAVEHSHDENCGHVPATESTPCTHEHDETCGYAETVTVLSPCNHSCEICTPSDNLIETVCICEPAIDKNEVGHRKDCPFYTLPACTCPPVENGEKVHSEDCPLFVAPALAAKQITAFEPLDEEIRYQYTAKPVLPSTLVATVDAQTTEIPVTWSAEGYDKTSPTPGLYSFAGTLTGDYTLAEGVEIPKVSVMLVSKGRMVGAGTSKSPLQITTASQLAEIAALTNEGKLESTVRGSATAKVYLKIMNDIDLSGYTKWVPIGNSTNPFKGELNGDYKQITGMTVNMTTDYGGLFGSISGANVEKVAIVDANIKGKSYQGGIAGSVDGESTIQYCSVTGSVKGDLTSGDNIGGIVGSLGTGSKVLDCYSTATVNGGLNVGGIVGDVSGAVEYCYSTGMVSSLGGTLGGIGGNINESGILRKCVALNISVNGRVNAGGRVAGGNPAVGLQNNIAFIGIDSGPNGFGDSIGAEDKNGESKTAEQIKADGKLGWQMILASEWKIENGKLPGFVTPVEMPNHIVDLQSGNPFGGRGTADDPYQISTTADLKKLATLVKAEKSNAINRPYSTAHYKLMKNLENVGDVQIGCIPNEISFEGYFSGTFDGNGNTISGVNITQAGFSVGLFANSSGTVKNLGVLGYCTNARGASGGVVGTNSGTVENCYFIGSVNGGNEVGGIVGTNTGSVQNCYFMGDVIGEQSTGGVVGNGGTVTNCYATGTVKGTTNVGGVSGASSTITNCAALNESITGTANVGRVAGSATTLTGNIAFGDMKAGNLSFDSTTGENDKNGASKTIQELKTVNGFPESLTTSPWTYANSTLPGLNGNTVSMPTYLVEIDSITGNGTVADPYQISTAAQLAQIATFVNAGNVAYDDKHYKLTADIDLSGYSWISIGTEEKPFKGTFDGNGNTIDKLQGKALFGTLNGATVKNLGITGANVKGEIMFGIAGGIASKVVNSSSLSSCYVSGSVNEGGTAGALVGQMENSQMNNCYATGVVSGSFNAGGLTGVMINSSMNNCYAANIVIGSQSSGGLTSSINAGAISSCVALNQSVKSNSAIGRIAGAVSGSPTLSNNYAFGGMTNGGGTANFSTENTTNSMNGESKTVLDVNKPDFWKTTVGFTDSVWTLAEASLPILANAGGKQVDSIPLYLSSKTIAGATVSGTYTYNGKLQTPKFMFGDTPLVSGTDYTFRITSTDNIIGSAGTNVGNVWGEITGKGEYSGKAEIWFSISPAELSVKSGTVQSKNYDGKNTATVTSVKFEGLQNGETLAYTTDYTVNNASFASANAGSQNVSADVALVRKGSVSKNYTLKTNGNLLTGATGTINKIAPTITVTAPNSLNSESTGTVTVKITNPTGVTTGFPAASEIKLTAENATVDTLTATANPGEYTTTATIGSYAENTKAKFTATVPNDTTNYTAYTATDKFAEVEILEALVPVLSNVVSPTGENLTYTTAKISFTANKKGDFYYLVKTNDVVPTVADILAAIDSKKAMTADDKNTIELTGLSQNTAHKVYIAAKDSSGAETTAATVVSFTTTQGTVQGSVTLDNTAPKVGDALTVNTTGITSANTGTLSYQWYRGDNIISGATNASYTTTAADVGSKMKAKVTAANYTGSLYSPETTAVAAVIAAPVITGSSDSANTATADKTVAQIDDTVTYTVTFADGFTPTLTLSGNTGTLSVPTKSNNKWVYTYKLVAGDSNITATVNFAPKTLDSISSTAISMFADDTNNATETALKTYLDGNAKVTATYDNGTTAKVAASYTIKTGTWNAKGGNYVCTTIVDGKKCDINVSVTAINASITAIDDISKQKEPINGYSSHDAIGLPKNLTVTYSAAEYTSKTDTLAVTWSPAVPVDFGKTVTVTPQKFTGTVTLPAWATGGNTSSVNVTISDKTPVTISGLTAATNLVYNGSAQNGYTGTAQFSPSWTGTLTYTYYEGTGTTGTKLSDAPANAGTYTVVASIPDSDTSYMGKSSGITFTIDAKEITVAQGNYKVSKGYDGTTNAGTGSGNLIVTGILAADSGVSVTPDTIPAYSDSAIKSDYEIILPISIKGDTNNNYKLAANTIKVPGEITNASATATIDTIADYDYTGSQIKPTVIVKVNDNIIADTNYTVEYGENINAGVNAGSVTVKAKSGGNYTFADVTAKFTINKIAYTGTAITGSKKIVQNTAASNVAFDLSSLAFPDGFKDKTFDSVVIGTNTDGLITGTPTISGTKVMFDVTSQAKDKTGVLNVTVKSTNYNDYTIAITITTVDKTLVTISGLAAATNLVYNGSAQNGYTGTISVEENKVPASELVYTYMSTDSGNYNSTTAPKNAGDYKLVVSIADSNTSYIGSHADILFRIAKKDITVKADDKTITKGATLPAFTVSYTGFVGTENENNKALSTPAVATCTADGKTVGTFDITLSTQAALNTSIGKNYTIASQDKGTLTVSDITENTHTITANADAGGSISPSGTVTVNNGASRTFTITANNKYRIADVKVDNVSRGEISTYTFNNVTGNHTITATFRYKGDSGSSSGGGSTGGSGSSSGSSTGSSTSSSNSNKVETNVTSKTDENGKATSKVEDKVITNAIEQAKKETAKNNISVVLNVKTDKDASALETVLSEASVDALIKASVTELTIQNDFSIVTFDQLALNTLSGGEMKLAINTVDPKTLSQEAQNAIGERTVYQFDVTVNGQKVSDLNGGIADLGVPYTKSINEQADKLSIVYVDSDGKLTWLENSSYDAINGMLHASTPHFSIYGVGYKQDASDEHSVSNAPIFTDIENHWAKNDIDFVTSRGLFSGATATTFAPDQSMTRGMFVTVLGRMAEIDTNKYQNTKFADVEATAYFAPYVAWANANSIVTGTSDTTFSPEQEITRQEMAVMLVNYSNAIGYELPSIHTEVIFTDASSIAGWAKDAIKQMQMAGILSGKTDNTFEPTATATRAEVSSMLRRYIELAENTQSNQD